jgi:hypothetical protein
VKQADFAYDTLTLNRFILKTFVDGPNEQVANQHVIRAAVETNVRPAMGGSARAAKTSSWPAAELRGMW